MINYLQNVSIDKALKVRQGVFVHSYRDLIIQLKILSDSEFKSRFNDGIEIIKWIQKNFRDEKLLLRLELVNTRREFVRVLEKRINQLELESEEKKRTPVKLVMPFYINVVFFIVFSIVVLSFLRYAYLNDGDSRLKYMEINGELQSQVDTYRDRIIYLEEQNANLKDEFASKNIIELQTGVHSPADRIKLNDVKINDSVVLIQINNSYLSEFTDTDSMVPVLDAGAIGIEIIPGNESKIYAGDIVSYTLQDGSVIIHRVTEVGNDSGGWFAVTKGDNNPVADRDRVRFSQIKGILVGILY